MHASLLVFLSFGALTARGQAWTTTTDGSRGPCADHLQQHDFPVAVPLLCTAEAGLLKLTATATSWGNPKLRLDIDGEPAGDVRFPILPMTRTWEVERASLSEGLHIITFSAEETRIDGWVRKKPIPVWAGFLGLSGLSWMVWVCMGGLGWALWFGLAWLGWAGLGWLGWVGLPWNVGRLDLTSVTLEGQSGACSFDTAPGYAQAAASYTYRGMDVFNNFFDSGPDFSEFRKQQLFFASEALGRNADGSIDSTAVAEGFWQWIFRYSQQQEPDDPWFRNKDGDNGMWEESNIRPYINVSLQSLEGYDRQIMAVCEPCNGLSNLAFHKAAVWISCKGYPFDRDEYASLVSAFNSLAPGSAFLHICACGVGGLADTFTMRWITLQAYQILVRSVIREAGSVLSDAEKRILLHFQGPEIMVTDMAKNLTSLFRQPYDTRHWADTLRSIDIPGYETPITGLISFVFWALESAKRRVPGLATLVGRVLDDLLELFSIRDADFFRESYMPTVRKAFTAVSICDDAVFNIFEHMLRMCLTFVEALVYQEQKVPVPKSLRDAALRLEEMGLSAEPLADMKGSWDYYNGFPCRDRSDHATWHEKSAHGLVHMMSVAGLFATHVKANSEDC